MLHALSPEGLADLARTMAGRPLLAAVAVSAKRGGTPAPGFFRLAAELGVYFGPERGPQAALFHAMELERVYRANAAAQDIP